MSDLYTGDTKVIELKFKDIKITKTPRKRTIVSIMNPLFINNENNKNNKNGIIIFYAPWCEHCHTLVPIINELASLFHQRFTIGAYNIEDEEHDNQKLREYIRFSYFPLIKHVTKKGILKDYNGTLEKDDLLHFICTNSKCI
jgi:thiol-disulfide isomerase/thioredoxin